MEKDRQYHYIDYISVTHLYTHLELRKKNIITLEYTIEEKK